MLSRFRNAADAHIDLGYLIPGRIVHHAGLRQIEDALEGTDGIGSEGTVDSVCGDGRYGRIVAGNAVKLVLHLQHFFSG